MIEFLTLWFLGSLKPELQLLPFRRWFLRWAFSFRWSGQTRLSNFFWKYSRILATDRTHRALAAYTTSIFMSAMLEGRE